MAEVLDFDEIWEEAVEAYHGTTSRTVPEREAFRQIRTPQDMREHLEEYQKRFKGFTSSDEKILNRVTNAMRPFIRLSEQTSSSHPTGQFYLASPILGATCFLFQAAGDIAQSYKWVEELFGKVEGYTDRLDEYIKGDVSPPLRKNIIRVFACFLKILACSEVIMKMNKRTKYIKSLFLGQDENIKKALDELDRLFDEEKSLVHAMVLATSQRVEKDGQQILQSSMAAQMEIQGKQLREDVIQWSSSTDFTAQYCDYLDKRQKNTGRWLLEDAKFQNWIEGNANTLFCFGSPGAGKTILATTVIQFLESEMKSDARAVAYVYCSYTEGVNQTRNTLLSAILRQLLQSQEVIPAAMVELYKKNKRGGRPVFEDMMVIIKHILQEHQACYLVIDALDESMDKNETYARFLDAIQELQAEVNLQVLITSRPIPEITERFEPESMVEIRASREDLQKYLDNVPWRSWVKKDENLVKQIKEGVSDAADGMFLLACLYVQWLQGLTRRKELIKSLEIISHASLGSPEVDRIYGQAYALTIQRIEGQSPEQTQLAKQALSWISYARRQLDITELCSALAIELDTDDMDQDNIPSIEEILSVCAGLVVIDKQSNSVRLVHYTTQEYLERTRHEWVPEAEKDIASMCLTYLAYSAFRDGGHSVSSDYNSRIRDYPLLPYLAQNWAIHVLSIEEQVLDLACRFLRDDGCVDAVAQVAAQVKRSKNGIALGNMNPHRTNPLHLTACSGLYLLSKELVLPQTGSKDDGDGDLASRLNAKDGRGRTPLMLASYNGHLDIVKLLLGAGADVNVSGDVNDNAVLSALQGNHADIVDVLLKHNANIYAGRYMSSSALAVATRHGNPTLVARLLDITTGDLNKDHALYLAAERGHLEVVKLLLDRGAGLEFDAAGPSATALMAASDRNDQVMVRLLLKKGARFYRKCGRSALTTAAINGHLDMVRFLLQSGAPVNFDGGKGHVSNPLAEASLRGHEQIVRMLLEYGHGVNHQDHPPLVNASLKGHLSIVRMLLDKGADINAVSKPDGLNAILSAAMCGHLEIVELLLDSGADVNSRNKSGSNPLGAAAWHGHEEIIELLLSRGATADFSLLATALEGGQVDMVENLLRSGSVMCTHDERGELLQRACLKGEESIAQVLIQHGANLDFCDYQRDGTAIQAAAEGGKEAIVKLLIENGADINHRGGGYGTALQAACVGRCEDIARLLIDHGADLEAQGGRHGTPLQAVSYSGYEDIVRLLIDHGADVNSQGGIHGNALQAASYSGHENIVRILIDHGADVDSQAGLYGSALQAASYSGCEEIVRLLIDHGADVNSLGGKYSSALGAASGQDRVGIVKILIAAGADLDADGGSPVGTALQYASNKGCLQVVQQLLDAGADVDADAGINGTALHTAIRHRHARVVDALLEANANVNKGYCDMGKDRGVKGQSPGPLYAAAQMGDAKLIQRLLALGADVDAWVVDGGTALIVASHKGVLEVVQLLLDAGADIDLVGRRTGSGIYEASRNGHEAVVRKLLAEGANLDNGNPFLAAVENGHMPIADLLREHGADIDAPSEHYSCALSWASSEGKTQLVRNLLDQGADPNVARGKLFRPLQGAAAYGHEQILQLFLDIGVPIDADESDEEEEDGEDDEPAEEETEEFIPQKPRFWDSLYTDEGEKRRTPALYKAAKNGMLSVVQLLIKKGARVNARRGCFGNALHAALNRGHEQVAHELLDHGADPHMRGRVFKTALDTASAGNVLSVVKRLIGAGSGWTWTPKDLGDALHCALDRANPEVAQYLLDSGADVFAESSENGSTLYSLCASDVPETFKIQFAGLLIQKGVDVNKQGGKYGSPLQTACHKQQMGLVQFLLDKGSYPNVQGGEFGNALQAASRTNAIEIGKLLIERGADVNARGGFLGTALQAAASVGNGDLAQLLLLHGADVNAQGGEYGNALQAAAASSRRKNVFYLLVEAGADINAQGGMYGTALQALTSNDGGRDEISLLLDKGANANSQGGDHGSALQAACANRMKTRQYAGEWADIVKMIIDRGADVNAQGGESGSALQAASSSGSGQLVLDLLARGADVNVRGGEHGTALCAAASAGHGHIVRILLDNGADVNAGGEEGNAINTAAGLGHEAIVRALLERVPQACINRNALEVARRKGYKRIIALLEKRE